MKTFVVLLGVLLVAESRAAPTSYDALDDAAAAALMLLRGKAKEEVGLLYNGTSGIARTPTVNGQNTRASGALRVPVGALAAIFHNHPRRPSRGLSASDTAGSEFSDRDKAQAQALRKPSYISAGEQVFRYDPRTKQTAEVLARFPIEELLQHIAKRRSAQNPIAAAIIAEHNRGR